MTQLPVRYLHELEAGMVVQCGESMVQLAYFPGDRFKYKGMTVSNKRRNKWFCIVLHPGTLEVPQPGELHLCCFDLVFGDGVKVFRLDPQDFQLTTQGQRFIAFSA